MPQIRMFNVTKTIEMKLFFVLKFGAMNFSIN